MMKHLRLTGADVSSDDIVCAPCDFSRAGGFSPEAGAVVLCQGKFMSKRHMEDTIVHELVHMYDHAKFKVDWNNLRHHACSEVRSAAPFAVLSPCARDGGGNANVPPARTKIRANSLSGDCRWSREIARGFVSFSKQHQASLAEERPARRARYDSVFPTGVRAAPSCALRPREPGVP